MQVRFVNSWFGPGGVRYRASTTPVEIPDELFDSLPSTAQIDGVSVCELRKQGREEAAGEEPAVKSKTAPKAPAKKTAEPVKPVETQTTGKTDDEDEDED